MTETITIYESPIESGLGNLKRESELTIGDKPDIKINATKSKINTSKIMYIAQSKASTESMKKMVLWEISIRREFMSCTNYCTNLESFLLPAS